MADRVLSQDEIDNVFQRFQDRRSETDLSKRAQPYDFRRPDRIAKDQLRAIHLLHENFARSLASSLSAYLRAYVIVNLVSVEQLSFLEFSQCLPAPTCIIALGMRPFDGNAVLEINPSLVFPILEMLLGGTGKSSPHKLTREITEIEQSILEVVYRIILHDLKDSWRQVTNIGFGIDSHETEPSLLQFLAPNEAVVAITLEIRIGESVGMMNIGIPSIVIKMLRQKFDQGWSNRRAGASEEEQARVLRLIRPAQVQVDAKLQGPTLRMEDLLKMNAGDVLVFDHSTNKPIHCVVNGKLKYLAQVVVSGNKRALQLTEPFHLLD
ncbi:MAG TPA: flagellar motor switch protein FliM [Bryobacteraceae bacterium]|nr:flagellar motor switch protein FliM [Bryobacteraceae bacterium]